MTYKIKLENLTPYEIGVHTNNNFYEIGSGEYLAYTAEKEHFMIIFSDNYEAISDNKILDNENDRIKIDKSMEIIIREPR